MTPSLRTRTYTLLRACYRAARRLFRRQTPLVSAQTLSERLNACSTCEFRTGLTCSICGCFIEAKARLRDEQCPVNNWLQA